jgi:hypothetical protein
MTWTPGVLSVAAHSYGMPLDGEPKAKTRIRPPVLGIGMITGD